MRKLFEYIGLISLVCFSFFITEKTATIVKNTDDIMQIIKDEYSKYEKKAINATIIEDTIIPGVCGKKVNISKSYNAMHKIGLYNQKLYQFENQLPNISLSNNYKKYIISGNKTKNKIYLFLELNNTNKTLLKDKKIKNYNFIVTSEFYINNEQMINKLLENNSILLSPSSFKEYKEIAQKYFHKTKNNIYCFNNSKDTSFLKNCSLNKSGTIIIDNTYYTNYLLNIKKNLQNGNFIKLEINDNLLQNLDIIEKYIQSKGIELASVDIDLKEC